MAERRKYHALSHLIVQGGGRRTECCRTDFDDLPDYDMYTGDPERVTCPGQEGLRE